MYICYKTRNIVWLIGERGCSDITELINSWLESANQPLADIYCCTFEVCLLNLNMFSIIKGLFKMLRATIWRCFLFIIFIRLLSTQKHKNFREINSKSSQVKFWSQILVLTQIPPSWFSLNNSKTVKAVTLEFYSIQ